MDRITAKKIIEINFNKGKAKAFQNKEKTIKAYYDLLDALDENYKISVGYRLSPLDTPMIIVGHRLNLDYPLIYCFDGRYYFHLPTTKTVITTDTSEVLKLIDEHFYGKLSKNL